MEERPRFSGKFLCAPESLCKVAFTRWYINFLTRKKRIGYAPILLYWIPSDLLQKRRISALYSSGATFF